MKILISNLSLKHYGGSEIWTFHMAEALLAQGHEVEIFTLERGEVFDRIIALGAKPFQSMEFELGILNHYDCIEKLKNYAGLKIHYRIQTCHGTTPQPEQPHPNINSYFAVSTEVKNYLLVRYGIYAEDTFNPVNQYRFRRVKKVLSKPSKVLILCVGTAAQKTSVFACKALGLEYEVHSKWSAPVWNLEDKINEFDLVIGYGRGVIESICCGRNVIVYDSRRYTPEQGDGLLTKDNFYKSLSHNFTGRATNKQITAPVLIGEINKATKQSAEWLYQQRDLFDVETITLKYLSRCQK